MQRIFLVEDSQLVLARLEAMIDAIPGTRVVGSATHATRAIRSILDEKPDTVLCDLKLATGSGFDVLRAVHAAAPEIDVYMLSNFASEPYRRIAAQLGARDFFDKSNDIERVRELVRSRAAEPLTA
ncbi:MAG TPA: response regulator [Burkholderiales bacterium]|nr:response regulator [Burkholderiales bacterium]